MTSHIDLDALTLTKGNHDSPDDGTCLTEAVALFAHEPHSDKPQCVSPVLAAFGRAWNDALPDDERQKLKPYIPRLVGTDDGADERRAWMATDWLARVHAPAWLRLAGKHDVAAELEALPEITADSLGAAQPTIDRGRQAGAAAWAAARDAAWAAAGDAAWAAARDAAWAAAWAAARDAAWDAARAAARAAAWDAARDAAWDAARAAARAAARDAARDATRDALAPTRDELVASAHQLLDRMIRAVEHDIEGVPA